MALFQRVVGLDGTSCFAAATDDLVVTVGVDGVMTWDPMTGTNVGRVPVPIEQLTMCHQLITCGDKILVLTATKLIISQVGTHSVVIVEVPGQPTTLAVLEAPETDKTELLCAVGTRHGMLRFYKGAHCVGEIRAHNTEVRGIVYAHRSELILSYAAGHNAVSVWGRKNEGWSHMKHLLCETSSLTAMAWCSDTGSLAVGDASGRVALLARVEGSIMPKETHSSKRFDCLTDVSSMAARGGLLLAADCTTIQIISIGEGVITRTLTFPTFVLVTGLTICDGAAVILMLEEKVTMTVYDINQEPVEHAAPAAGQQAQGPLQGGPLSVDADLNLTPGMTALRVLLRRVKQGL